MILKPYSAHAMNRLSPYSLFTKYVPRSDLFDFSIESLHERYPGLKNGFKPKVKVDEYDSHYLVSFRVPGLKEDDINIKLNDNTMTLKSDNKISHYSKTVVFKNDIDIKNIKAFSLGETYKIIIIKK